jgi:hypothetical protein
MRGIGQRSAISSRSTACRDGHSDGGSILDAAVDVAPTRTAYLLPPWYPSSSVFTNAMMSLMSWSVIAGLSVGLTSNGASA